ncbi:transposase family protein [Streptomyces sp. NPDC051636]|uniref:transposase family protein n=1 Tax=Streptomyces sp. NPDC051636 TaxID=3365663 RepID=UPI00378BF92D
MARAAPGQAHVTATEAGLGASAKHQLVFVDRLLATLVHPRHGTTHDVLACWFSVDRSTVTRAIGKVRHLLAERGCTVSPGVRLKTLVNSGEAGAVDGLGMPFPSRLR